MEVGAVKPETDTRLHMLLYEGRKVPTDQTGAGFNIQALSLLVAT